MQVLPPDDMWSTFADRAEPGAVFDDDTPIGSVSVEDDGTLHRFFVRPGFEHRSAEVLAAVEATRRITSMIVSTADPVALSTSLPRVSSATTEALLYTHEEAPTGTTLEHVALAVEADHDRACVFVERATGGPSDFIVPYQRERIERRELVLYEVDGEIVSIGECRLDPHTAGYAHLGIIVGVAHRGNGLGGAMMNTLVKMCEREGLTPLCSTTVENIAAQTVIRRAGFRSRHSVLRLHIANR